MIYIYEKDAPDLRKGDTVNCDKCGELFLEITQDVERGTENYVEAFKFNGQNVRRGQKFPIKCVKCGEPMIGGYCL